MPQMPEFKKVLQPMDAQVLGAAAILAAGVIGSGESGAEAMASISRSSDRSASLVSAAIALLTMPRPAGLHEQIGAVVDGESFVQNTRRVGELGHALLEYALGKVAAPAPEDAPVPRVIEVDKDGNPVFEAPIGPIYNLPLSHGDLHLIYWALQLAEGARANPAAVAPVLQNALEMYQYVHAKEVDLQDFVNRFEAAHNQARKDSGEI